VKLWRRTPEPPPAIPGLFPSPGPRVRGGEASRLALLARRVEGRSPRWARPLKHVLLFALTMFSVTAAGAMQQGVNPLLSWRGLVHLVEGLPFAATLLGILSVHEFGHYFAARRWGIRASLPYFIPLPFSFLGTFGAVIRLQSPIPHRRALLDIGAAGPLAGLIVAVAACLVGLPQSEVVSAGYFEQLPPSLRSEPIQLGAPLIFTALSSWLQPEVHADQMLLLGPVAFAGWVGLFITSFNLLPVGQLDGGHIVYALIGPRHRHLARLTFAALLGLGAYGIFATIWDLPRGWLGWLIVAILLSVFGRDHPPPQLPRIALDPWRRAVGLLCLLVLVLCFTPAPFGAFRP